MINASVDERLEFLADRLEEGVKGGFNFPGMELFFRVVNSGKVSYVRDLADLTQFKNNLPSNIYAFLSSKEDADKSLDGTINNKKLWDNSRFVINLAWQPERDRYEPDLITTNKADQRKGWATAMWKFLERSLKKYMGVKMAHSPEKTTAGNAWVNSLAATEDVDRLLADIAEALV